MSKKPNNPTTGAQTLGMGDLRESGQGTDAPAQNSLSPEEIKQIEGVLRKSEVERYARCFAEALLQNPKIGDYLYGSPLDPGVRGDAPNAGALLAQGAKRLAEDYLAALEALHAPKTKAPEPMTVGEVAEVAAQNDHPTGDFPLD